mmetsp:Transcript_18504/g.16381  ORF Transcript_18504/g.16381 Transcript_18504/m.16381 type:complete len:178 (-) Transcript_18504:25-558(-)
MLEKFSQTITTQYQFTHQSVVHESTRNIFSDYINHECEKIKVNMNSHYETINVVTESYKNPFSSIKRSHSERSVKDKLFLSPYLEKPSKQEMTELFSASKEHKIEMSKDKFDMANRIWNNRAKQGEYRRQDYPHQNNYQRRRYGQNNNEGSDRGDNDHKSFMPFSDIFFGGILLPHE